MALISLTEYFGDELPDKLQKLWEFITEPLEKIFSDSGKLLTFKILSYQFLHFKKIWK